MASTLDQIKQTLRNSQRDLCLEFAAPAVLAKLAPIEKRLVAIEKQLERLLALMATSDDGHTPRSGASMLLISWPKIAAYTGKSSPNTSTLCQTHGVPGLPLWQACLYLPGAH